VVIPRLVSRIEQRDKRAVEWIACALSSSLGSVAEAARQGQIVQRVWSAARRRDDVLDFERISSQALR
jgi:hypothetical protein